MYCSLSHFTLEIGRRSDLAFGGSQMFGHCHQTLADAVSAGQNGVTK